MTSVALDRRQIETAIYAVSSYLTGLREAMRRECDLEQGPVTYWPNRIMRAEQVLQSFERVAKGDFDGETSE